MAPQSWNRYAYVIGNPLRLFDPNGEEPRDGTRQLHLNIVTSPALSAGSSARVEPQLRYATEFMASRAIQLSSSRFSLGFDGDRAFRTGTIPEASAIPRGRGTGAVLVGVTDQSFTGLANTREATILLGTRSSTDTLTHELPHILLDANKQKSAFSYVLTEFFRDPFLLLTMGTSSYSSSLQQGVSELQTQAVCGSAGFVGPCQPGRSVAK